MTGLNGAHHAAADAPAGASATAPAVEPGQAFLALRQVGRIYGEGDRALQVLAGADLTVLAGDTVAVVGPSGSGKTTLLNLMAGLDRPTSGEIWFQGQRLDDQDEEALAAWRRASVGFIFQDFRLLPRLTAWENVALPMELLGASPKSARQRATELLEGLGLAGRLDHVPPTLSGGEKQRVAIARAFAHKPALVFADEPTGNLDPRTSQAVMRQLLEVHAGSSTTLITVTHDMEVAGLMARQVRISEGRVEARSRAAQSAPA